MRSPAAALRAIERSIRTLEEVLELLPGERVDGKTEGCGKANVAIAEIVGRGQYFADHLPEFFCADAFENQRQDEGKFVAVMTRHHRAIRNAGLETMCDLAEYFVAGIDAEQVIDRLEGIKIDNPDRKRRRISGALERKRARPFAHAMAIAQSGERIRVSDCSRLLIGWPRQRFSRFHICFRPFLHPGKA